MRVYKFLNLEFGLKTLREKKLKISTLDDLNDPFELLAYQMTERKSAKSGATPENSGAVSADLFALVLIGRTRLFGRITATSIEDYAGNSSGLLAYLAGALLLPSVAIFLGTLSGTSKPFEAILTILWYIGPMNNTPGFDFTGAANGFHTISDALFLLALGAGLLLSGFTRRARSFALSNVSRMTTRSADHTLT